jgi:hypothetical protein
MRRRRISRQYRVHVRFASREYRAGDCRVVSAMVSSGIDQAAEGLNSKIRNLKAWSASSELQVIDGVPVRIICVDQTTCCGLMKWKRSR